MTFDWYMLRQEHMHLARNYIGEYRDPDLTIAPDGFAYLYRWHVVPRNSLANIYLHIQVADDPERPEHDHPWDNLSTILVGGYDEHMEGIVHRRREGDVVFRRAEDQHRLLLKSPLGYTITLFSTGPKRRRWGFWFPDGWRDQADVIENLPDGRSIFKDPTKCAKDDAPLAG